MSQSSHGQNFLTRRTGSALAAAPDHGGVQEFADLAQRVSGRLAGWRVRRAIGQQTVALVAEAVQAHFVARRDEIMFRTQLALDNAKKRAIAESLEDTAIIEREIVRMTRDVTRDLVDGVLEEQKSAALAEVREVKDLRELYQRGEITERRLEQAIRRVETSTDDKIEKAEIVVERVIANLGSRLDAALRDPRPQPLG